MTVNNASYSNITEFRDNLPVRIDRVECNQYSPTKGRPRLKKAIADAYSPYWGRALNPDTEVTITTGANEGESGPWPWRGWTTD